MIIETERLFLREMTAGDFDVLYKVLADSDSMKYGGDKRSSSRVRGRNNSDHPF